MTQAMARDQRIRTTPSLVLCPSVTTAQWAERGCESSAVGEERILGYRKHPEEGEGEGGRREEEGAGGIRTRRLAMRGEKEMDWRACALPALGGRTACGGGEEEGRTFKDVLNVVHAPFVLLALAGMIRVCRRTAVPQYALFALDGVPPLVVVGLDPRRVAPSEHRRDQGVELES